VAVVLIHGITPRPDTWLEPKDSSMVQALGRVAHVVTYTYDYAAHSLDWVTDPAINPPLALALQCLATASGHKVVVIAHSMGGLATQEAQSLPSGSPASKILAGVITLGTPTLGSELELGLRRGQAAAESDPSSAVFALLLDLCGALGQSRPAQEACGPASSIDTPAGRAMTPGSAELQALPQWPTSVARHRIAGSVTFHWSLLGAHLDVPMGDGVVSVSSATAGGTDTPDVVSCTTSDPNDIWFGTCSHGSEPGNATMLRDAVAHAQALVTSILAPPRPPTVTRLSQCPTDAVETGTASPLPPQATIRPGVIPPAPVVLYSDTRSTAQALAPTGWSCKAVSGEDGTTRTDVWPPGATSPYDAGRGPGVQAYVIPVCSGCVYDLVCGVFHGPSVDALASASDGCSRVPPAGETDEQAGPSAVLFTDPPDVKGTGSFSGEGMAVHGVLVFNPDQQQFVSEAAMLSCVLPNSEASLCTAAINDFRWRYAR
jgi:pimeloyl-ACP methyl ester carboxylesterase